MRGTVSKDAVPPASEAKRKLIAAALKVAKKYPCFPTGNKKPCWSNSELKVGRGEGGYKIATQDPARVKELFSHRHATEIAVPMGAASGLMCLDVDLYKDPSLIEWVKANSEHLDKTLTHSTRSGGLHYFFKHPGNGIRMPSTLRPGVDLKAGGTGYVCWPGTEGYTVVSKYKPKPFPEKLISEALISKGGSGKLTVGSGFNETTDDELIETIEKATDLYPPLRTLAYRLPMKRLEGGGGFTEAQQVEILQGIMDDSVAAKAGHPRHDDWVDRRSKIVDLVVSAIEKHSRPVINEETAAVLVEGPSLIDREKMIAASRPTGPQRATTIEDIEALVAEIEAQVAEIETVTEFAAFNAEALRASRIEPIDWLVQGMIPKAGTISLAGVSNVGKTRWLGSFSVLGAAGQLSLMGLPDAPTFSTLWLANEERVLDIKRRVKAVALQHDIKMSLDISVRGKDAGMLRLVGVNGAGNPEIDEENVAKIVSEARRIEARLIIFDPYVTLSNAMDENSATSAAMLTKVFVMISSMTGAAALHAHHTPKDRSKDNDWYRGDSGAWRGSGAIYSALDCGFTLANWMPKNAEQRKSWKQRYLDEKLSRWVVLDTGKIREGAPLEPVFYELVGQEMEEGEGDPIGVCALSSEHAASNALLDASINVIATSELAKAMFDKLGEGEHQVLSTIHKLMNGVPEWPEGDRLQGRNLENLCCGIFTERAVPTGTGFDVKFVCRKGKKTNGRWIIVIKKVEQKVE